MTSRLAALAFVLGAAAHPLPLPAAANSAPNLLPAGSFDNAVSTYVPWAGVDAQNDIHGIEGRQLMVTDNGSVTGSTFAPSAAVGDLNGDGKPDLVVADTCGFLWYYPNSGAPQKPAFTQGEVIPIWLAATATSGATEAVTNVVPRIQLLDFQGVGKLDIAAGTFAGELFRVPNVGSTAQPDFKPTLNIDLLRINTHRHGMLWCNYLAPFFTTAFGSPNQLDLVMGEGTYSANSIYLLRNTGSSDRPTFDEDHLQRIIPGMGLEQLTPNVVDWNNDGKPDIICGDRTGYLNLYLNTTTDPEHPSFAPGVHVKVGGIEKLGAAITVTVCDLTGNHLPNLLIGLDTGIFVYAQNTGKLGSPAFASPPEPLKGVLPPTYHYIKPSFWFKAQAYGMPYELVSCVNPETEPGFSFPDGVKARYALKFALWPYKNQFFQRYAIQEETQWNEHQVYCSQHFSLKYNTRYHLHFWVMAPDESVSEFGAFLHPVASGVWKFPTPRWYSTDISAGSQWSEVDYSFETEETTDPAITTWDYNFEFHFHGQSTFYVSNITLQEEAN